MTIQARMNKINQVTKSASELTPRNKYGNCNKSRRFYSVKSIRTGKSFQVVANWFEGSEITVKVQLYTFDYREQVNRAGNHQVDFNQSTVCYQALGALKFAAKQANKILCLCENKVNADLLLRLGGELVKIENLGGGVVWGVVR